MNTPISVTFASMTCSYLHQPCRDEQANLVRDWAAVRPHKYRQSTARYAHLDDKHLLYAAQQVGDVVQFAFGIILKE